MRLAPVKGVVATALVAVGLAACLPTPTPWRGPAGTPVGVVGDSLVNHAQTGGGAANGDPDRFVDDALNAAGYRSSLSSMIGARTGDLAAVDPFPTPGPTILVVGLGTNDMKQGVGVPVATAVGNIVSYVAATGAACTAVVTIVDEPSWGLHLTAPAFNTALRNLAAARADVIVADWAPIADAHPEYFASDGVHHTAAGQAAYRELIVDAADTCAAIVG